MQKLSLNQRTVIASSGRSCENKGRAGVVDADETRFLANYARHRNATRAYRETWPASSYASAATSAYRLIHTPRIQAEIKALDDRVRERLLVTEDTITNELAKLAFLNPSKFVVVKADGTAFTDLSLLDAEDYAAITEIKSEVYLDGEREVKSITIKLAPKTPALELLGNKLRMWSNKVELSTGVDIAERIRLARAKRRLIDITPGQDSG